MSSRDSLKHTRPTGPEGETGGVMFVQKAGPPRPPPCRHQHFLHPSRSKALSGINVQLPLVMCNVKCCTAVPRRFVLHFPPRAALRECAPRWVGSGWAFSEHVYEKGARGGGGKKGGRRMVFLQLSDPSSVFLFLPSPKETDPMKWHKSS